MFLCLRDIVHYVRTYFNVTFKARYLLSVLFMLCLIIWFNYYPVFTLNRPGSGWWAHFLFNYLLYFIPFGSAYLLQYFYYPASGYLKDPWFWALVLLAPAFFSFRVNFTFLNPTIKKQWPGEDQRYWLAIFNLFTRAIVVFPVFVIWWIKDRTFQPLYGFKKTLSWRPYGLLLLLMVPLLFLASNNPGFLKQYPRATHAVDSALPSQGSHWLLYEVLYAFDFFSIEFFFRGFLILAFVRLSGIRAIVPAACFYCCIHLGKPMPEAISSIFGGVLLGIVTYNTKSIWGGLLIHVGIAAVMELLAFKQQQFM
jgi:membrane protease YdiL (CAAX protease family)